MTKKIYLITVFFLLQFGTMYYVGQIKTYAKVKKETNDQIFYLFFMIKKDLSGSEVISLAESKVVNGRMKSLPIFDEDKIEDDDLVITVTDTQEKVVVTQNIKDPLHPELESFGDDIKRLRLKLNESEFSVRFPYSANLKTLKIEKIINSKRQLLFTLNF